MRVNRLLSGCPSVLFCLTLLFLLTVGTVLPSAAQTTVVTCTTGALDPKDADGSKDLLVNTGPGCTVPAGTWKYKNVNIYGGGVLTFTDAKIDFYASSILVEDGGSLLAGTRLKPIGTAGGVVTIHIYGAEDTSHHNKGITCKTGPMCNVPDTLWKSNSMAGMFPDKCNLASAVLGTKLPSWFVDDCFYGYAPIDYDDGDSAGYFGTKVLALSYGGTIQLFGRKGAQFPTNVALPSWSSGTSWARLKEVKDPNTIVLDRAAKYWAVGDHIVVSSTDYLPGHAEEMEITATTSDTTQYTQLTVRQPGTTNTGLKYEHNATPYDISAVPAGIGPDDDPNVVTTRGKRKVETRAAVGLLTRSIRIVSAGDTVDQTFDDATHANPQYSFGAHSIVRQSFKTYQVQGVEFFQMGQGGEIMHYPIHFHMARKTPQPSTPTDPNTGTYVKDCTIHDSMTRWITLHATQGVTLARNVGYLSIGHGFYLEDGTETDNRLYSNLGVFARAALDNTQNPRKVPGILAATIADDDAKDEVPYKTDADHPAVFWITNTWNDFQYNAAAGAGSCGMCYWLPPTEVSGLSRYQVWSSSYAGEQVEPSARNRGGRAGMTPLKSFQGNSCSSAMNSFTTVGETAACAGARLLDKNFPYMPAVLNPLAPPIPPDDNDGKFKDNYYPQVIGQAIGRRATKCPDGGGDCRTVHPCDTAGLANCMVTVVDHYTTSFNWADTNYSAMWMRPQWYLLSNSAITDVQNGGVTFVTGGDYTGANIVQGYWALAHKNVFIGSTQPDNPLASAAGPANPKSSLRCVKQTDGFSPVAPYCLLEEEGVSFPLSNFAVNQRFFNIYDGPAYESSNAYLEIKPSYLTGCNPFDGAVCPNLGWMYGFTPGTRQDPHATTDKCYLPNAAIGWKQPNAFFYPPAFRSNNLYFSNVSIRHFVVEPKFLDSTYTTDDKTVADIYCAYPATGLFTGFTDIDRQTELTDEDGTVTGLVSGSDGKGHTISVNQDPFFNAGKDDRECASDVNTLPTDTTPPLAIGTARTSPYDYVTTVVYPDCGLNCGGTPTGPDNPPTIKDWDRDWANNCETAGCYGVPLHRLSLFQDDDATKPPPLIRMAGAGIAQRSTLTVNHASYYMNTTAKKDTQDTFFQDTKEHGRIQFRSLFQGGHTYYTFFLYATSSLKQTYKLYVGGSTAPTVEIVRANISASPVTFSSAGPWPAKHMSYDGTFLTLDVDATIFTNFATEYTAAKTAACQPQTFCTATTTTTPEGTTTTCGCNSKYIAKTDPKWGECDNACGWAGKDIDCPMGGCYGFSVKMPDDFVANDQGMYDPKNSKPPPAGSCPAATDAGWSTPFQIFNSKNPPDDCKYTSLPPDKFRATCP